MPEVIQVAMRLYADDCKLLGRVKAIEHVNRVQISLNNSVTWADLWNIVYNFKKMSPPPYRKQLPGDGIYNGNPEWTYQS